MIVAGILPMPIVFCLRRFQILKVDLDIHQGSIRRNETTASTKVMMDDDDVSSRINVINFFKILLDQWVCGVYNTLSSKTNLHLSSHYFSLMSIQ